MMMMMMMMMMVMMMMSALPLTTGYLDLFLPHYFTLNSRHVIKHLIQQFCFSSYLDVSRDEVEGNIEILGDTKLSVSRGTSN